MLLTVSSALQQLAILLLDSVRVRTALGQEFDRCGNQNHWLSVAGVLPRGSPAFHKDACGIDYGAVWSPVRLSLIRARGTL